MRRLPFRPGVTIWRMADALPKGLPGLNSNGSNEICRLPPELSSTSERIVASPCVALDAPMNWQPRDWAIADSEATAPKRARQRPTTIRTIADFLRTVMGEAPEIGR